MSIFDAFDRIRIISLPTRTDRRRAMRRELASLGLDRHRDIDFFDGIRPDDREGFPTVGSLGCFLSHAEVLRTAADDGVERLFVFEDDAMLRPDRMPDALPDAWNLVHLGGNPIGTGSEGTDSWWRIPPDVGVLGAHAYGVDRTVMEPAWDYLQAMRRRPAGHPDGGPMQADGALHWLRRSVGATSWLCAERPFVQRPSRTDLHQLAWFDRTPVVRDAVELLRRFKQRVA